MDSTKKSLVPSEIHTRDKALSLARNDIAILSAVPVSMRHQYLLRVNRRLEGFYETVPQKVGTNLNIHVHLRCRSPFSSQAQMAEMSL
jgi:hypothetical protein